MSTRAKLMIVLFAVGVGGAALSLIGTRSPIREVTASMREDLSLNPFFKINDKARTAKGSKDKKVIEDLATQVVYDLTPSFIPSFTRDKIKERVALAEAKHRDGKAKGITEQDVVKMFDELATRFSAPDYTRTSWLEVRAARLSLSAHVPDLVTLSSTEIDLKGTEKSDKKKVLSSMSPTEAVAVAMFLLHQKITNEAWQVTPQEFAANLHKKQMEMWQSRRDEKDGVKRAVNAGAEPKGRLRARSNPKQVEMMRMIRSAAVYMEPEKLTGAADAALNALGIGRDTNVRGEN